MGGKTREYGTYGNINTKKDISGRDAIIIITWHHHLASSLYIITLWTESGCHRSLISRQWTEGIIRLHTTPSFTGKGAFCWSDLSVVEQAE